MSHKRKKKKDLPFTGTNVMKTKITMEYWKRQEQERLEQAKKNSK